MNNDVMPSIVQMEKQVLMNLVKEVEETLATDIDLSAIKAKTKIFTAAEMWSIRKKNENSIRLSEQVTVCVKQFNSDTL